jgi:uncharacterized membrane protein
MLSIVLLAPIYSILCNVDLTWVFKVVYPFIYAFMPVGLFWIYQKKTNSTIAFLSAFYFMSVFSFYLEMPQLARQEIAEFFLVLLLITIYDENLSKFNKSILSLIFSFMIIISHYGLSYIFAYILIFSFCISYLANRFKIKENINTTKLSVVFIIFYISVVIGWYIYIAGSSPFESLVTLGNSVLSNVMNDLFNPGSSEGLNLLTSEMESPLQQMTKILNLSAVAFISIGIVSILILKNKYKFDLLYIGLIFASYLLCMASTALPFFASALNTTRIYHISIIFLSPLCILGLISISNVVFSFMRSITSNSFKNRYVIISIYLSILLIFSSGVAYQLFNDPFGPVLISKETILDKGTPERKVSLFYTFNTFEQDVYGINWLSESTQNNTKIYTDYNRLRIHSYGMIPESRFILISDNTDLINASSNSYYYIGYPNVKENILTYKSSKIIVGKYERITALDMGSIQPLLLLENRVYNNGGSMLYMSR